jgi:CRISPR-associated protein Cas2
MEYIAAYDIADPRRLRRVARVMQAYGSRVQKSVFECQFTHSLLHSMCRDVARAMELEEDSLRVYPLFDNGRSKQTIVGRGMMLEFPSAHIL